MPLAGKAIIPGQSITPRSPAGTQRPAQPLAANSNARPSGIQDSNLRPLVPQTSTHFPLSADFNLEWFRGELAGMTTRASAMEPIEIACTFAYIHIGVLHIGVLSLGRCSSIWSVDLDEHPVADCVSVYGVESTEAKTDTEREDSGA